ncbi:MAG: alpha-N-arabinofuranosidase [Cyclobacteriaceae bacterium]
MKTGTLIFITLLISISLRAQNQLVVHTDKGKEKISKHIYGHFAEHLGRCIYGGFYVGEGNTKIPNTKGIRNDVMDALIKLKVPNLRWPGGCFADTYHWKDGIGPKEKRPKMVNVWWGGVTEDNSFGTHDFLDMCEKIGAEPYLAGNVGSGTVQDFTDWVQYVNFDGVSPMSIKRQENGHDKPWQVSLWGVGNEAWGCGGNMKPEYYANIYRQYATFMTDWGNSGKLFRVASGANSSDYNWTEVLMRDIPHNMMEGVALHHYSVIDWNNKGSATDFNESLYFATMKTALFMEELVSKHSAIMDKYDPTKKIALVVDEWGGWYNVETGTNPGFLYQQNTMRDAMIAGVTLNVFNNHSDRVRVANLAQTINVLQAVILTNEEKIIRTPTYHVMEMYNVHQDATLLPLELTCSNYQFEGKNLPAISASASRDPKGITHISLVNIDAKNTQEVAIDLQSAKFTSVTGRILTSQKIQDHNTFENSDKIKPEVFKVTSVSSILKLKLPPFSVVVLELK